jgi:hypothetical protein
MWPTKGYEGVDTKLASVLLPPNPILPLESNSKILICVIPALDPRNIGYILVRQEWRLFMLAS